MYKNFLPIIFRASSRLGTQFEGNVKGKEQLILPNRLHQFPLRMSEVWIGYKEYSIPDYYYESASFLQGMPFIIGTKTCPEWARQYSQFEGSPPKEELWVDYADCLNYIIKELKPTMIEIWNEPDMPAVVANGHFFGSWPLVTNDLEYKLAGVSYGKFLKTIYPILKAKNPQVIVIAGAISMITGTAFLAGIKSSWGTRAYADRFSFHCYTTYYDYLTKGGEKAAWNNLVAYTKTIRSFTNLPLLCTEFNLIRKEGYDYELKDFEDAQAKSLAYALRYLRLSGLSALEVYCAGYNGNWGGADMVLNNGRKKPIWYVYEKA